MYVCVCSWSPCAISKQNFNQMAHRTKPNLCIWDGYTNVIRFVKKQIIIINICCTHHHRSLVHTICLFRRKCVWLLAVILHYVCLNWVEFSSVTWCIPTSFLYIHIKIILCEHLIASDPFLDEPVNNFGRTAWNDQNQNEFVQ